MSFSQSYDHSLEHNTLKTHSDFFTSEVIAAQEKLCVSSLDAEMKLLSLGEMVINSKNKFWILRLLLLLSGDINLNPGPQNIDWRVFEKRGFHMSHINVNSLISKIVKIRETLRITKVSVLGITERITSSTQFPQYQRN